MQSTGGSRKRQGKNQVTVGRALSKLGVASRTLASRLIASRRVSLNGEIVRSANSWIDLRSDELRLDGIRLRAREKVYFAMNKPRGVVTTRSDEIGRQTVYDFIPVHLPWMFPVGRLDKETEGLLFFSNDTEFGDAITDPATNIPKTYLVEIDRPLRKKDCERIEAGLRLKDGTRLLPAVVTQNNGTSLIFTMTIVEGKNRQIRRMCEHLGYEVRSLKRTTIGPVNIASIPAGNIRPLSAGELAKLEQLLGNQKLYARHNVSNR